MINSLKGEFIVKAPLFASLAALNHSTFLPFRAPEVFALLRSASGVLQILRLWFAMFGLALLLPICSAQQGANSATPLASTPPMGWNSWDSYGLSITESEFKSSTEYIARHLKQYGWQYVVIDEGWYLQNPEDNVKRKLHYVIDKNGRYIPAPNRFPSASEGQGFKPLAEYVHSLGLKFGIHLIRGIPREAVAKNLPIAGSSFRAADAANTSDVCLWRSRTGKPYYWNFDNYGVKPNRAGQAYYDSLVKLYADWGVDFIKVDCIASPYKEEQVRMISLALKRAKRPIILSLSPGPTPIEKVNEVRRYAQMWRIANDFWDVWARQPLSSGVENEFDAAAKWAPYAQSGHWPDADMLPIGYLGPRPSTGVARETALSHNEQRAVLTLWSMLRSPLFLGSNVTANDPWTTSLLTNSAVIAVDQHSKGGHPVIRTADTDVWLAQASTSGDHYIAVFNKADARRQVHYSWRDVHLTGTAYARTDLWNHTKLGPARSLDLTLQPHACILYLLTRQDFKHAPAK